MACESISSFMTNPLLKVSRCKSLDTNSTGLVTRIRDSGVTLEQQSVKDSPDFFIGRLNPELSNRKRVGSFGKFVDLVIIRKLKIYFHLMHRDRAGVTESPFMVDRKAAKDRLDVLFARVIEVCVGQVCSQIKQVYGSFFVHINLNKIRRGVT